MRTNLVFIKSWLIIVFISLIIFPVFSQTETSTISTYYPAPTGVYQSLRFSPTASVPVCNEGTMYYDSNSHQLMLCIQGGVWQGLTNFWTQTGTVLYPNNTTTWNVGIGTANPNARLSVSTTGTQLTGTATSAAVNTMAGALGTVAGNELALANIGFTSGNQSSLGVRAVRVSAGTAWDTTAVGIGMDVDNTPRAGGAAVWLNSNGGVGVKTSAPQRSLQVAGGDGMRLAPSAKPTTNVAAGDIVIDQNSSNAFTYHNGSAWATAGGGGGCYVDYRNSCMAGFTNKGSLGTYGYCDYCNGGTTQGYYCPPGGSCRYSGCPGFTYKARGTAVVCCQ